MRHFVLTRMVYSPEMWSNTENKRRLRMLQAVTVPSLLLQSSKAWEWCVAVDPTDPYRAQRLEAVRSAGQPVRVLYATAEGTERKRVAMRAYRAPWADLIDAQYGITLTTRLDDDDGLHADAIKRIQSAPWPTDHVTGLIQPSGIRVWNGKWSHVFHHTNAMATCVSPAGDPTVVYDYSHKYVGDVHDVQYINGGPDWLWVRHVDALSRHRIADAPIDVYVERMFPTVDWDYLREVAAPQ